MMLNAAAGSTLTGAGCAPSGASQSSKAPPGATPSSEMHCRPASAGTRSWAALSRNRWRAWASRSMEARLSAVDDGASGATTTPARRAPRNSAA